VEPARTPRAAPNRRPWLGCVDPVQTPIAYGVPGERKGGLTASLPATPKIDATIVKHRDIVSVEISKGLSNSLLATTPHRNPPNVNRQDIVHVELPRAVPLVYYLDEDLRPVGLAGAAPHLSGEYVGDPEEVRRAEVVFFCF